MNILIIPDKFKGTLSAAAAAGSIARGWRKARPLDRLTLLPMSDGGDGFGEVMSRLLGARRRTCRAVDAAHGPCRVSWWWQSESRLAIIESSQVIGLAMLPAGKFHPFELDTLGLGKVFRTAAQCGARRFLVGIGGSATNDGGFGLAHALGWDFLDEAGDSIRRWPELKRLKAIHPPKKGGLFQDLVVAVDVQNPLLGRRGATRVYGPQKGLRARDFRLAESCLERLSSVWRRDFGEDLAGEPGAGAAGGLGFGLRAFLGAKLEPGFELFAGYARLEARLQSSTLVVTGEGRIDDSTLMGKGVGQIARRCLDLKIPCIGLAGVVKIAVGVKRSFSQLRGLTDLTTEEKARARPAFWLTRLADHVAHETAAMACRPSH